MNNLKLILNKKNRYVDSRGGRIELEIRKIGETSMCWGRTGSCGYWFELNFEAVESSMDRYSGAFSEKTQSPRRRLF
jgi:hypothetical protein